MVGPLGIDGISKAELARHRVCAVLFWEAGWKEKKYFKFVEERIKDGRRPGLVGGTRFKSSIIISLKLTKEDRHEHSQKNREPQWVNFGVSTGVSMKTINLMVSMFFLGILIFISVANAQPDPAIKDREQCTLEKLRAAAQYLACRLQSDQSKCANKVSQEFDRAEMKYGSACPTTGDVSDFIQQHIPITDRILLQLTGVRYVDNGDGTVSDTQTGLTWEKKDDSGGIHDKDNFYSLSATGSLPDGTAYTVFLPTLNKNTSTDGNTTITGCFAGHCDWRLPTISELQTILLQPCATSPCIDPVFGIISTWAYWSGTSDDPSVDPTGLWAWQVLFQQPGYSYNGVKTETRPVRAVRSGF